MAKIVELCGSPGVGKTTIYKAINARWKKKYKWVPAHYLWYRPNFYFRHVNKLLPYLPDSLRRKIMITSYNMRLDNTKTQVKNRFVAQYPEYIDACWNDLGVLQKRTLNGIDLRFQKAEYLSKQIGRFQFLRESKINKIAVLEEGLIHLLDMVNFYDSQEEIIQIMNVMPLPDGLIYIKIDVSENVKRIMQRGELIGFHTSLSPDQLQELTQQSLERRMLINKVLEEKGIPILHIDAKEPAGANADKIISFVEKL